VLVTVWISAQLGAVAAQSPEAQPSAPRTPALVAALTSGTESEREEAAFELAETAPPAALPLLIRALRDDPSSAVRQAAAFALGAYHPPSAETVEALMDALQGRAPQLKTAVATTLSRLGAESELVLRALVAALGADDARTRQSALIVLERIGPPVSAAAGAVPAVAECLRKDPDERARRFAVSVLAAVGEDAGDGAVSALLETAHSDASERVRQYSVEALPAVGAPAAQAVPVLTEAVADPDWGVRAAAVRVLGSYGPAAVAAVPALEKAREDAEEPVRNAAVEALEKIHSPADEL